MKVDAMVFDYGNTLVLDPFEKVLKLKAYDFLKVMEKNGYEVSRKRFTGAWRKINETLNYPFCSHFAQDKRFIRIALEKVGVTKNKRGELSDQLIAVYRDGLKYVLKKDKRLPQVKEVLLELKNRGKKLYILSNEMTDTLGMQISFAGLGKFFEKIISSQSVGFDKPDPKIFRHLLNVVGLPEGRIVYVGDDPERDIKPPKTLGMKAILLNLPKGMSIKGWRDYGFRLKAKEKPDFVIKDFSELLQIVE
jgi:putative hydrolase of the HAD superfamily